LIQVNVESRALKSGLNDRDALAKGLSAAFWFCGACAASGKYLRLVLLLSLFHRHIGDSIWNAWLADVE